jgi:hypothetical protein
VSDRPLLGRPRVEAAVEQPRLLVAEQLEEPQAARRTDAGALVVDDDLALGVESRCSTIQRNARIGAGSVSIRLTP